MTLEIRVFADDRWDGRGPQPWTAETLGGACSAATAEDALDTLMLNLTLNKRDTTDVKIVRGRYKRVWVEEDE